MENATSDNDELLYSDFLEMIDDFRANEIEPLTKRAEFDISSEQMKHVLDLADQTGLLPHIDEVAMGLWDLVDTKEGLQFHLQSLRTFAKSSAAVAYTLASVAMSTYISRELKIAKAGLVLSGRKGLGRYSLAHYLRGDELSVEDESILEENFLSKSNTSEPFFIQSLDFQTLLIPVFENKQLYFHSYNRDQLDIEKIDQVHGLNDVPFWKIKVSNKAKANEILEISNSLYCKIISLSQLALLTISLGATKHAYTLALDYAKVREQGGHIIAKHPAVLALLMKASTAIASVQSISKSIQSPIEDVSSLNEIFKLRLSTIPLLREGATSCMQVLGGYGYMKDYGIEKIVRDVNHLSIIQASSIEMNNFISAIEVQL